jgi:exosortase E/protease (VPEID-CTERM system)
LRRASNARILLAAHFVAFFTLIGLLNCVPRLELSLSPRGAFPALGLIAAGVAWLGFWLQCLTPLQLLNPLKKRAVVTFATSLAVGWVLLGLKVTEKAWNGTLGKWAMWQVYYVLHVVSRTPTLNADERIVGMSGFEVAVEDSCSGSQGIGLIWLFLGGYLWLARRNLRFPQSLVLLPVATLIMWVANTFRIVALVCLGAWYSPAVAIEGFHSQAGWLIFICVSLALVFVTTRWRFFATTTRVIKQPSPQAGPVSHQTATNHTAVFLLPFLALTASMMITQAFSSGFDVFYPIRVIATAVALWIFRHEYRAMNWRCSWVGVIAGVAAFALWIGLEPFVAHDTSRSMPQGAFDALSPGWATVWLVFRVVGSVATVPIAEELAFRGFLLRRLISPDFSEVRPNEFRWVSLLVSSAAFGALHGERWLAGFLVGILFAIAQYRKGNLADAILAHAVTNALLSVYVLATKSWNLW